jgi:DNA-binding NarL/FixJ family response regulator
MVDSRPPVPSMNRIRVLLVEDHALVRSGIRDLLERTMNMTVVAEAGDGREALRLIPRCKPDVVLLDISMPGLNGLEATKQLTKLHPNIRVVILSMHASEEYVWQAMKAGAHGYLVKTAEALELKRAIQAVADGSEYFNSAISSRVVSSYARRITKEGDPLAMLTSRQREVLQLIAEGCSTKQIAEVLKVSVKTVESHRAQLMERLAIYDVAGLVRFAIRTGLVSQE